MSDTPSPEGPTPPDSRPPPVLGAGGSSAGRAVPGSSVRRCNGCATALIPGVASCPFCGTAWDAAHTASPSQRFPLAPALGEPAPADAGANGAPLEGQIVDQSEPLSCINCGTDVRGVPLTGFCSCCGTPIINTFVTGGGIVNADLPCLNCGYVLRGLPSNSRCPECAADVGRSLHGNYLRYSSREYVDGMRRGTVLVLASCVMKLVVNVGLLTAGLATGLMAGPRASGSWLETLGVILATGTAALDLIGWWLIAKADPAMPGDDPARTTRQWLMVALITSAVLSIGALLVTVTQMTFTNWLPGGVGVVAAVAMGVGIIGWLVDGVRWFTSMRYLMHLSKRIPDPGLQSLSTTLMWLVFLKLVCGLGDLALFILNIVIIARLRRTLMTILDQIPERTT